MAKLSAFEGFMLVAICTLLTAFVWPRLAQGSQEVLASKASLLQLQLQSAYDLWRLNGGVHGKGNPANPEELTQNLLECLTSEEGQEYCSKLLGSSQGRLVLGSSGVYESPKLSPSPSDVRAAQISPDGKRVEFVDNNGALRKGVLINNQFVAVFENSHWIVAAVK